MTTVDPFKGPSEQSGIPAGDIRPHTTSPNGRGRTYRKYRLQFNRSYFCYNTREQAEERLERWEAAGRDR